MVSRYILIVILSPFTLLLLSLYFSYTEDYRFHSDNQLQNIYLNNNSDQKYLFLKSKFHCESGETNKIHRHVYWTVFAGHRNRLQLQERYWHTLKEKSLITEVHLWDFSYKNSNKKEAQLSREWIYRKSKQFPFILVKTKPGL